MVKMKTKNKIPKLISSLLIVSIIIPNLFFSQPKQVNAQAAITFDPIQSALKFIGNAVGVTGTVAGVTSTSIQVKNVLKAIAQEFLKAAAKKMLAEMTKSTVNWINTGFHGQPLFVQNPQSFFQDITKSEVKNLVDQIGYDRLKSPFGKQFALQVIDSYKRTAQQNSEYSLNKVINDEEFLNNYRINFARGGWDGFLLNTQYAPNNPIGYNITEASILGEKIAGTQQTAVQKVKDTLNQGMGFLSPQTCPSNPSYNNGVNEFNRPSFSFNPAPGDLPPEPKPTDAKYQGDIGKYGSPTFLSDYAIWQHQYNVLKAARKNAWAKTNDCPNGLASTTPGSVAANSIMNALGTPMKQGELSAAMGNSLSTVFDSLINHFLDKGLSSLASKINPQQTPDTWSYNGETLGSPSNNTDTFGGPDQEIILSDFKKQISGYTTILNEDGTIKDVTVGEIGGGTYTPGDIDNTKTEIALMDNKDYTSPGILQLMQIIPIETQKLDECLPGLNKGWEARLKTETERNSKILLKESGSSDDLKVKAVTDVLRELNFAVASYKDWVTIKMMGSLPNAVTYMDEISNLDTLTQKTSETSNNKRDKEKALARLRSLQNSLSLIPKQPNPQDSDQAAYKRDETKLISIKKQYDAIKNIISNTTGIEETKSTLNTLKDTLENLNKLNTECVAERRDAGWSNDGNNLGDGILMSTNNQPITVQIQDQIFGQITVNTGQTNGSEIGQFCSVPIISGYSHGDIIRQDDSNQHGALKFTFRNPHGNDGGDPGYEDLPMLNAREVYGDDTRKFNPVVVDIDCNTLFKAKPTDYKHSGDPAF